MLSTKNNYLIKYTTNTSSVSAFPKATLQAQTFIKYGCHIFWISLACFQIRSQVGKLMSICDKLTTFSHFNESQIINFSQSVLLQCVHIHEMHDHAQGHILALFKVIPILQNQITCCTASDLPNYIGVKFARSSSGKFSKS